MRDVAVMLILLICLTCLAIAARTAEKQSDIIIANQAKLIELEARQTLYMQTTNNALRALELLHEANRDEKVFNNQ